MYIEAVKQELGVGVLEVVGGHLHLLLMEHVAVGDYTIRAFGPHQVVDTVHALQVHGDALKPVGELAGDRVTFQAAHLLEVGELGYFHAVQPDFPTQTPGAEGG